MASNNPTPAWGANLSNVKYNNDDKYYRESTLNLVKNTEEKVVSKITADNTKGSVPSRNNRLIDKIKSSIGC